MEWNWCRILILFELDSKCSNAVHSLNVLWTENPNEADEKFKNQMNERERNKKWNVNKQRSVPITHPHMPGKATQKTKGKKSQQQRKTLKTWYLLLRFAAGDRVSLFPQQQQQQTGQYKFCRHVRIPSSPSHPLAPEMCHLYFSCLFFAALRQTSRRIVSGAHTARQHTVHQTVAKKTNIWQMHFTKTKTKTNKIFFPTDFICVRASEPWLWKFSSDSFIMKWSYSWFMSSYEFVSKLFCIGISTLKLVNSSKRNEISISNTLSRQRAMILCYWRWFCHFFVQKPVEPKEWQSANFVHLFGLTKFLIHCHGLFLSLFGEDNDSCNENKNKNEIKQTECCNLFFLSQTYTNTIFKDVCPTYLHCKRKM